jgi:ribosome-associated translation inhibitor RaiA
MADSAPVFVSNAGQLAKGAMTMEIQYHSADQPIRIVQARRIEHHLPHLERRLVHFSEPSATVTLREHPACRQVRVELQVALGPQEGDVISHQEADAPDHAVRSAVTDAERQLERRLAAQRDEPTTAQEPAVSSAPIAGQRHGTGDGLRLTLSTSAPHGAGDQRGVARREIQHD